MTATTRVTTQFTTDLLTGSLGELRARRAKLEAFITEATEIDAAIREMERVLTRLGLEGQSPAPRLAAVPAQRQSTTPTPRRPTATAAVRPGSNHEKALEVLRAHPRGLSTTVVLRETGMPQGSVSVVLADLVERGHVVKVGMGFWRAKEHVKADAA